MQNHYYDVTDPRQPYTHSAFATPGSIAPVNATRVAPDLREGFCPCWNGTAWDQVEIPAPEAEFKAPEEPEIPRAAQIKAELADIDAQSIRPLRAIANADADVDDYERLSALSDSAAALREELKGIEKA